MRGPTPRASMSANVSLNNVSRRSAAVLSGRLAVSLASASPWTRELTRLRTGAGTDVPNLAAWNQASR